MVGVVAGRVGVRMGGGVVRVGLSCVVAVVVGADACCCCCCCADQGRWEGHVREDQNLRTLRLLLLLGMLMLILRVVWYDVNVCAAGTVVVVPAGLVSGSPAVAVVTAVDAVAVAVCCSAWAPGTDRAAVIVCPFAAAAAAAAAVFVHHFVPGKWTEVVDLARQRPPAIK